MEKGKCKVNCKDCGENLCGDGISIVFHCPNANENIVEYTEPDANPIYCGYKDWKKNNG